MLAPAVVVLVLAELHAHLVGHYSFTGTSRFAWDITFVLLLEVAAYTAGLPDGPRTRVSAVWTSLAAVGGAAVAISLVQLVGAALILPREVVLGSALVLVPLLAGVTVLDQRAHERGDGATRVLAVLGPDEAAALERDLAVAPEHPAQLARVLATDDAAQDGRLLAAGAECAATVLVLGRLAQLDESVVAQAAQLHSRGMRVRTLTLFYDEWLGKLPVSELERTSLMFDIQELHAPGYARTKRAVDVLAGLVGSVVLLVVIPFVWTLDLVGNRGPLFFRQERVGKGGIPFTIYKFRTMVARPGDDTGEQADPPAGAGEGAWTAVDDPRLRPVGRWMRRLHLDELPQAVNLLAGDLSLVGPRPEQPRYVAELADKIPFYDVRHLVQPGVTGWAQVKFPYGASVADALEKLQYEFWYLRHQGPLLDARIAARTLRSVFHFEGR